MGNYSKPMQPSEEALQELEAAEQMSTCSNTVLGWKRRYEENGVAGLESLPSGKRKGTDGTSLGDRVRAALKGPPPVGSSFWTAALLSRELDVPVIDVRRYLRRSEIDLAALRQSQAAEEAVRSDPPAEPEEVPQPVDAERQGEECAETTQVQHHGEPHHVRIILREEDAGIVLTEANILVEHILADAEHFDVQTVDGFQRDWNMAEQGITYGFLQLLQTFLTGHVDAAKKNGNESRDPETPDPLPHFWR